MKRFVIAAAVVLLATPAFAGEPAADSQTPVAAPAAGSDGSARPQADASPRDLTTGLSVPITLRQPQAAAEQIVAQAATPQH